MTEVCTLVIKEILTDSFMHLEESHQIVVELDDTIQILGSLGYLSVKKLGFDWRY